MNMDQLKRFLVELPSRVGYNQPLAIRQNLYWALYYTATNNGKALERLFPHISKEELDFIAVYNYEIKTDSVRERNSFFNIKHNSTQYSHSSDRACARPFKKGEPVYRCEQCSYDDSCVLCVYCFNKEDHIDHNVLMYISKGSNGGVCDCGDPEAFVNELHCKCSLDRRNDEFENELKIDLGEALKNTIEVCLDYILDVSNFSVQTLPFIHKNLDKSGSPLTTEAISNYSSLPSGRYGGGVDQNSNDMWYLILWNDEHHDFAQARRAISAATGYPQRKADEIAREINSHGRCVLREASSYQELLKYKGLAELDGLVTSIASVRDYTREIIVKHLLNWLLEITNFSASPQFAEISKNHFVDLLLAPSELSKVFPAEFVRGLSINDKRRCFENGLLYDGKIVNMGLTHVKKSADVKEFMRPVHIVLETSSRLNNIQNSRLQLLLLFQIRFVSLVRKKLSKLIIPPVLGDNDKKARFCEQFIEIYPNLFTVSALSDREEDLNILGDISSQLLTCPRSVHSILTRGNLGNVLGPVTQIIEENSTRWNYDSGYPSFVDISKGRPQFYKSIEKAVLRGIRDVSYLLDKCLPENKIFLERDNLLMLMLFLRNFQGYWPIERKYGDHVERELFDYQVHLTYSTAILNIVKSVATVDYNDEKLVVDAVRLIYEYLNLRKLKKQAPGIAEFRVSKESTSFINPINSLLSFLLEYQNLDETFYGHKMGTEPFMNISDISLRSVVLSNQVRVGFWIRNGFNVSRQANLYTVLLRIVSYYRDIHLNQIAAITDDPRVTLYNILDRWELLTWYLNDVSHTNTVYEERFSSICEKLIIFLYNMISNRIAFRRMSSHERALHGARESLVYSLCDQPRSYTSLRQSVDLQIGEFKEFDLLLDECANYQAPTGLTDSGIYRLKPEIYKTLDSLNLQLDSSEFHTASEAIVRNLAKIKGVAEDSIIISPQIVESDYEEVNRKLGDFMKTVDFAKLLYKLLQVAIDDSDETYLPQLLHLIHAIIIDDELKHGPDYLSESFVSIPVSDLLLTIVESTMSKHIIRKADYLVDQFISKDKRIVDSLVDCFGEEYVSSYKKRKIGLFESDSDKKKRLAKARTERIMRNYAKKRQKFLEVNNVLEDYGSEGIPSPEKQNDFATCVLCGDTESTDEPFGLLVSNTKASALWKIPENANYYSSLAFESLDSQENPKNGDVYGTGYNYAQTESSLNNGCAEANVLSTCGHYMHYSCYQRSTNGLKHFPCPLCHNLHDSFVPSFMASDNKHVSESILMGDPISTKYNQLITSTDVDKSQRLANSLFHKDYKDLERAKTFRGTIVDDLLSHISNKKYCVEVSESDKNYNKLQNLSVIIADTIRINEISTRLKGNESLFSFIDDFPSTSWKLLRALVQCRVYAYESGNAFSSKKYDYKLQIETFWDSDVLLDGVFNEVVVLFFQTNESFNTLAKLGYAKLLTIAVFSLLERCSRDPGYVYCLSETKIPIDEGTLKSFEKIVEKFVDAIDLRNVPVFEKDFLISLYYSIERILLPLFKQLLIFREVISRPGDEERASLSEALHKSEQKGRVDSSDIYTNLLNLSPLKVFIDGLFAVGDSTFDFEKKVFEIVLNAKIPKYMHKGVLSLEYPAIVKLIDLPTDYTSCITDYKRDLTTGSFDFIICLHCGSKLKLSKQAHHMSVCNKHTSIFYHPRLNILKVSTHIEHNQFTIELFAPYLTVHGEAKRPRTSGKATLNDRRYTYLNKLWLDQGLYGFVTRSIFGARQQPGFQFDPFNFAEDSEVEDEFDDVEYI